MSILTEPHRLREARRDGYLAVQIGGEGKGAEIDKTFIGRLEKKHCSKRKHLGPGGVGMEAGVPSWRAARQDSL